MRIGWLLRGVDGATRRAPYARLPPHGTRWPRTGQGRGGAADGRHPPVAHLSQGLRPGVPLACVAPGCHARGDTRCGAYVPVSRCLGVPVSRWRWIRWRTLCALHNGNTPEVRSHGNKGKDKGNHVFCWLLIFFVGIVTLTRELLILTCIHFH